MKLNLKSLKSILSSKTLQDSIVVLGASIISSALGFVFISILGRNIGPELFGIYSTVINYVTFLSAVIDIGISQTLINFVGKAKSEEEKKSYINTSLFTVFCSTLLFSFLATLLYQLKLRILWNHDGDFAFLIFTMTIVITLNIFFLAFFQALKNFWQRSILDVTFAIFRIIIVFLLLSFGSLTLTGGFNSIIYAYLIAFIYAFFAGRKFLNLKLINQSHIFPILNFSKWVAGINFSANLYGRLDVMMLAWLSSNYLTGIYSAAARFISIFPLVTSSLSSVVSPRFATFKSKLELNTYFKKTISISFLVCFGMSLLLVLAKPIILIAYGQDYFGAIQVFQLLVLANLPLVLSIPATNAIIFYFKKPKLITLISAIQLIGLVLLNYFLIPNFTFNGPVFSLLAMNLLGMLSQYIIYFKLNKNI